MTGVLCPRGEPGSGLGDEPAAEGAIGALDLGREQAVRFRLRTNDLHRRLPAGALSHAARFALQDTVPRSGLLSLHARIDVVAPSAWEDPALVQLWSPRTAVHIVPAADVGVFTLGRMPRDPEAGAAIEGAAGAVSRALAGRTMRKTELGRALGDHPAHRAMFLAAVTGRFLLRWDARDTVVWEVPPPAGDPEEARLELCRRHLRAFGPSTPRAFAWWAGVEPADAATTWRALGGELMLCRLDEHDAWLLAEDEPALWADEPVVGARLLPPEDLKLLGQDRLGLFAGPAVPIDYARADTYHPGGVLVDGRLLGAWGRKGGQVEVKLAEPIGADARAAVEAEALAMPIPGAAMRVRVVG